MEIPSTIFTQIARHFVAIFGENKPSTTDFDLRPEIISATYAFVYHKDHKNYDSEQMNSKAKQRQIW